MESTPNDIKLEQGYGLGDEVLAIAEAIGETMVSYEPKLAISHNICLKLGIDTKPSGEFRLAMFGAHLRTKLAWHPEWEAQE